MKKILLFMLGVIIVPAIVILFVYSAVSQITVWTYVAAGVLLLLLLVVLKIKDEYLSKGMYLGVALLLFLSLSTLVVQSGVRQFFKVYKQETLN